MKKVLLLSIFSLLIANCYCQSILVIVNADCKIYVDGDEKGKVKANDALKVTVSKGEHYIQAKGKWNGEQRTISKTITIDADKQTMVNLTFVDEQEKTAGNSDSTTIKVADVGVKIPGTMIVGTWMNDNPNKEYPDYPAYYYGFEKGDEIVINYGSNSNSTNSIDISTYPAAIVKYSNKSFTELHNIQIKVEERGVYKFTMSTKHMMSVTGNLSIKRIPANVTTKNFNTGVVWKDVEDTTYTVEQERYLTKSDTAISNVTDQVVTVHSRLNTSNSNKNIVSFILPENTVLWSYYIGVDEDKSHAFANATQEFANSAAPLAAKIPGYGTMAALALYGISYFSQLTAGNATNYCIVDYTNMNLFNSDREGIAYKAGTQVVSDYSRMTKPLTGTYYICLTNTNWKDPFDVTIKITAIVVNQQWGTRPVKKMSVVTKHLPFNE